MHRSGTSLLTRLLEEIGLFVGNKTEGNNEAIFFKSLNIWMFRQANAWWDVPENFDNLLKDREIFSLVENVVTRSLKGFHSISYLGLKNYLIHKGINELDFSWGWKDPLNTYTLPIWLRIFPNSKVIYIERHGVDVAQSLKVRRDKLYKNEVENLKKINNFRSNPGRIFHSLRCATLDGAFNIWEEYVKRGRAHLQMLPESHYYFITYEKLLENCEEILTDIAGFCNLNAPETIIKSAVMKVNKDKSYSYRNNPKLLEFSHKVADRLLGYKH
jgi:hypothetical protein